MKKMFLWLVLAALVVSLCPAAVAIPLDPNADASLTLHYQKDGVGFENLQIGIYRIAQAHADGTFTLIEPFSSYPIDIQGITVQEQWDRVAETLWACMVAGQVTPDRVETTDEMGTVRFEQLDTGLYFVRRAVGGNEAGIFEFRQFLVYVPTSQQNISFIYDVEAFPKCVGVTPKERYTVTKLWQDGGYTGRPGEITVDIYLDGTLWESQVLNSQNNWSYTWSAAGNSQWTVAERVPQGYTVTVQQNKGDFTLINTRQANPDNPQTGDTFSPLLWVALMGISGSLLLILSIYSRRRT